MSSAHLFRFSSIVLLLGAVIDAVVDIVFSPVFPNTGPGLPICF